MTSTPSVPDLNPKHHGESILRWLETKVSAPKEIRRLGRELARVRSRLEAGEYQRNSFAGNKFNIPERMEDFLSELEFYSMLGRKWAGVISAVSLSRTARVLDLCPGLAPKVELGLYYSGFRGEIVACDSSAEQLARLRTFIGLFNASFNVTYRCRDMFKLIELPFDAVMGNHILDDLLLARAAGRLKVPADLMYESETVLAALCHDIENRGEQELDDVSKAVVLLAGRLLNPHGLLILTHYPSHIERILKLKSFGCMVEMLLKAVRRVGRAHGFQTLKVALPETDGSPSFRPDEVMILTKKS